MLKKQAHPSARQRTEMYEKHTVQNCMYKWSCLWWTHDVRSM